MKLKRFVIFFDCYGTLIDWYSGLRRAFLRCFPIADPDLFLRLWEGRDLHNVSSEYHNFRKYKDILIDNTRYALNTMELLRSDELEDCIYEIALSIIDWEPFGDVKPVLLKLRQRYKLGIISNTDREFLLASVKRIGIEFDYLIPTSELGVMKPARETWLRAMERFKIEPENWIQVSSYPQYDLIPAKELGLKTVLVDRYSLGEYYEQRWFDAIIPDMEKLPEALERLC